MKRILLSTVVLTTLVTQASHGAMPAILTSGGGDGDYSLLVPRKNDWQPYRKGTVADPSGYFLIPKASLIDVKTELDGKVLRVTLPSPNSYSSAAPSGHQHLPPGVPYYPASYLLEQMSA